VRFPGGNESHKKKLSQDIPASGNMRFLNTQLWQWVSVYSNP